MQTYKVGGAVRDRLLGLPVSDTDWVVVGTTPEHMLKQGYRQVGRDFPVFLDPDTHEEYALARTERKSGKGYTGFEVYASPDVSLEEDLLRRDLTINAMAEAGDGTLIDPCGGQQDLEARLLRHVSPAFTEDPLRVLRVARFAARFADLGFTIADETLELMKSISRSGELSELVAERIWQETARALAESHPEYYFVTLHHCFALREIYPELEGLFITGEDEQMLEALRQTVKLVSSIPVRFAALVHQLNVEAADALCSRLKVPVACRELALLIIRHSDISPKPGQLTASSVMSLLESTDAFRRADRFHDFLLCCKAIKTAEHCWPEISRLLEAAFEQACSVNARQLLEKGLKGPELGAALREARLAAIGKIVEET